MRHRKAGKKLGRTTSHRRAMLRNMATSLLQEEHIITTLPKAKVLRPVVEKYITLGKRGTLHARRQILSFLMSPDVAHKVMAELAPRFADRPGGYTRIIKLGVRVGDKAETALIELVGSEYKPAEKKKGGKAAKKGEKVEEKSTEKSTEKSAEKAAEKAAETAAPETEEAGS